MTHRLDEKAAPTVTGAGMHHPKDPLHGVTLQMVLTRLVAQYGWETLGRLIRIRCFMNEPSISSSLRFLRKTPWAREKVEKLYLRKGTAPSGKMRKGTVPEVDRADSLLSSPVPTGDCPL